MGHGSESRYQRNPGHSESRRDSSRATDSNSYNSKYKGRQVPPRDINRPITVDKHDYSQITNTAISVKDKNKNKDDNFDIIFGLSSQMAWDERPDVEQLVLAILSIIKWLDTQTPEQFSEKSMLFERIMKNKSRISSIINSIPNNCTKNVPQNGLIEPIFLNTSSLFQELLNAKHNRSRNSVYDSFARSISKLDNVKNMHNRIVTQEEITKRLRDKYEMLRESFASVHKSIQSTRVALSSINIS